MSDLFFLTNTFTSEPFEGGSAGVFLLREARDLGWMLGMTRAMNLTDAAFLIARSPNRFNMRYFAGFMETDFGVPATLAAAHVLYEHKMADAKRTIGFFTHGGAISATIDGGKGGGNIEVIFPELSFSDIEPPEQILQGVDPTTPSVSTRGKDYIVQITSESRLRKLQPQFRLLDPLGMEGLILTSTSSKQQEYDFIYRTFQLQPQFWPDTPIASSALLALGRFWAKRLGKTKLKGFRSGPRGRAITIDVDADKVKIFGNAITILKGELALKN